MDKKFVGLLSVLLAGSVGATVAVYQAVRRPNKSSNQADKFGRYLSEKQYQDALDRNETPDEIRRAQLARSGGQFSKDNYGEGSLGFVRGAKMRGAGSEGTGVSGGVVAKSASGTGTGSGAIPKGQFARVESKFETSGSQAMSFGQIGGSGGKLGSGPGGISQGVGAGAAGSLSARSVLSRMKKAVTSSRGGTGNSKRGAIGDLKRRTQVAFGGAAGADFAAGALDQAMAGKGAAPGLADFSGLGSGLGTGIGPVANLTSVPPNAPGAIGAGDKVATDCAGTDFCWKAQVTGENPSIDQKVLERWKQKAKGASKPGAGFIIGGALAVIGVGLALMLVPIIGIVVLAAGLLVVAFSYFSQVRTFASYITVTVNSLQKEIKSPILPFFVDDDKIHQGGGPLGIGWPGDDPRAAKMMGTIPTGLGSYLLWYKFWVDDAGYKCPEGPNDYPPSGVVVPPNWTDKIEDCQEVLVDFNWEAYKKGVSDPVELFTPMPPHAAQCFADYFSEVNTACSSQAIDNMTLDEKAALAQMTKDAKNNENIRFACAKKMGITDKMTQCIQRK